MKEVSNSDLFFFYKRLAITVPSCSGVFPLHIMGDGASNTHGFGHFVENEKNVLHPIFICLPAPLQTNA